MRSISVQEINAAVKKDARGFAEQVGAEYHAQIRAIAEDIRAHVAERPIVLLSGPSGSGKTTSAQILESYLDQWGCETHTLSMDNYFRPFSKEELKLVEEGKIDLEAPERMDIPFLNEQLAEIVAGRTVDLPKYDFVNSARVPLGESLTRKPGEVVILEGIHALNPDVICIPQEQTCGIYVSVRTRVTDGDQTLHPSYIRLMRRMLRDRSGRGRTFEETVRMYESVQRGEDLFIMPYKHRATYDVDTFHDYELAVYRAMCEEDLAALRHMPEIAMLEHVLEALCPMSEAAVPADALVREFIGNSLFAD